ncbi:Rne/Rng family ribonuclease [Neotabrizicola shimadae]|uniref:Ribonuclease E n=1 Tax=Neotabrizicola shimadae TaxID=2807096 RepID=A0A8G0ZTG9_9RHOB|nr:ribonuclease E/G [Neotabrizicola shimadae]QYZ68437.1 Rne/Rng family ribonuclease [Neotabrizicola shimadae]
MPKKMLIDATHAEETRVVVVDGNKVEEFDFETVAKRQLAGNIYLAKVTRVEPSLQAAFVDYGGNRHGFLAFAEIHPDYYQIPVADRRALIEEERALARAEEEEDSRRARRRPAPKPKAEAAAPADEVKTAEVGAMDVVDLGEDNGGDTLVEEAAAIAPEAEETHFHAIDHASDSDDEIESIAEEDVAEEISAPRKPRARKYKIQEVIKVRQIMLVQVVKEERGNKGAALTTYLSLAGRYCVLMPNTARGGGISRKITQAADRKKLKEIAGELDVPEGAGLIIRTAGAKRTKAEIKRDYEYLMRLWEQVRDLTLRSIAPAPIYEEGNLIKRSIRDLYNREIDEILVEGAEGYRVAKDFMKMIMPSHAKVVQPYMDQMPLFARYQVESYLGGMFNPVVQLKSGGYIVIGVTEALVAIDVNSGRATKEGSIEETALKTNLEAAEEIARQLRLRDLAGLIVIDFIDMEERKNNAAVEKRLKDKLKTDRARIQVGRISGFGLMEMSRQRLRPGMLESTTQPCPHCHGTGLIRSDDSMALTVLRALEEEGTRKRSKEVLLKAPVGIINYLINQKREHIALIEARYGMSVRLEADPALISPDYSIEKFKTATRVVPEAQPVISGHAGLMGAPVEEEEDIVEEAMDEEDEVAEAAPEATPEAGVEDAATASDGQPRKKRRRRRRRRGGAAGGEAGAAGSDAAGDEGDDEGDDVEEGVVEEVVVAVEVIEIAVAPEDQGEVIEGVAEEVAPPKRVRKPRKPKAEAVVAEEPAAAEPVAEAAPAKKPARSRTRKAATVEAEVPAEATAPVAATADEGAEAAPEVPAVPVPEAVAAEPVAEVVPEAPALSPDPGLQPANAEGVTADPGEAEAPAKPRRSGWWSLGR